MNSEQFPRIDSEPKFPMSEPDEEDEEEEEREAGKEEARGLRGLEGLDPLVLNQDLQRNLLKQIQERNILMNQDHKLYCG